MSLTAIFLLVSAAFVVLVTYTLFFGDSNKNTVIGKLNRLLESSCDLICGDRTRGFLKKILGDACCHRLERTEKYICFSKNPIMPSVYVAFVVFGWVVFYKTAWPLIGQNPMVPDYHKVFAVLMVSMALGIFGIALKSDPGRVTSENVQTLIVRYPYDNQLYHENKDCTTCKLPKPARSKHCRICDRCISRFDHHCPWLNNCVGENNLRYFLSFLLANAVLCMYGFFLILLLMVAFVDEKQLWYMYMYDENGVLQPISFKMILSFVLHFHSTCACLGLALGMIALVLYAFLGYHLYLVYKGTTTNETYKWKDLSNHYKRKRAEIDAAIQEAKSQGQVPNVKDDIPHIWNSYNRGFVKNFAEIFFPSSKGPKTMAEKAAALVGHTKKKKRS